MAKESAAATPQAEPNKGAMWAALIVAFLGWMFDGMEMGLYTFAVPPALRYFFAGQAPPVYLGISTALFLVGMSAGGVVFGRLGDKIGRVRTMIITVLVYALFTGLSGLCHTFPQLAVCRFLGAMGLGGEWGLGVALVMETWPNTKRPVLAGVLGAAANVGFLTASLVTGYLARHPMIGTFENWRVALMIGFVPALLTLVVRLFVKESEAWHRSQARGEKSKFADLFAPELKRQSLIGIAVSAVAVLGMWGVFQGWMQLWVEELVKANAAPGITEDALKQMLGTAKADISRWNAVGSIIGAFLGGVLAEKLSRRNSYSLFCIGAVVVALLMFLTNDAVDTKLLSFALLGGVFSASFFGWLPLYLPELFPTRIRATAEGLTFNCGRIISAVGVFFTGALSDAVGGPARACALMSAIYILGLVVIRLAPETKGGELPE